MHTPHISNDGRFMLTITPRTTASNEDGILCIRDSTTGKKIQEFQGHNGIVTSAAYTAGDTLVISASEDTTLKLWNTSIPITEPQETSFQWLHRDTNPKVDISGDGKIATSVANDSIILWDIKGEKKIQEIPLKLDDYMSIEQVRLSYDGQIAEIYYKEYNFGPDIHHWRMWDVETGNEIPLEDGKELWKKHNMPALRTPFTLKCFKDGDTGEIWQLHKDITDSHKIYQFEPLYLKKWDYGEKYKKVLFTFTFDNPISDISIGLNGSNPTIIVAMRSGKVYLLYPNPALQKIICESNAS